MRSLRGAPFIRAARTGSAHAASMSRRCAQYAAAGSRRATCTPMPGAERVQSASPPLLRLKEASRDFDVSRSWLQRAIYRVPRQLLRAVDAVSLTVERGETFALVGESGCGKSTVARLAVGLHRPSAGSIAF